MGLLCCQLIKLEKHEFTVLSVDQIRESWVYCVFSRSNYLQEVSDRWIHNKAQTQKKHWRIMFYDLEEKAAADKKALLFRTQDAGSQHI